MVALLLHRACAGGMGLQKRYKLLLHCAAGYNPIHNNQETHSQRGRTQHVTAPGGGARAASTRLDRTSTTHAVCTAPSLWRGCRAAARGKRGVFLVSNRPICKEHP